MFMQNHGHPALNAFYSTILKTNLNTNYYNILNKLYEETFTSSYQSRIEDVWHKVNSEILFCFSMNVLFMNSLKALHNLNELIAVMAIVCVLWRLSECWYSWQLLTLLVLALPLKVCIITVWLWSQKTTWTGCVHFAASGSCLLILMNLYHHSTSKKHLLLGFLREFQVSIANCSNIPILVIWKLSMLFLIEISAYKGQFLLFKAIRLAMSTRWLGPRETEDGLLCLFQNFSSFCFRLQSLCIRSCCFHTKPYHSWDISMNVQCCPPTCLLSSLMRKALWGGGRGEGP